ncbi:MAG TPA: alpha/beta hydrolase [Solirubrobacteraceae bacterium]|nr:alpha/beta hydrolase [Solirubrobacteraceae bacterium]
MIAYERTGSGPPLLLIHGLGSCKEVWKPVVPLLAREREVVTLDLPGFGASPPGPRTVDGLADAVVQFAAELGIERPHVAGNSMGGGIALALGATDRVRSACAVSPIGFANDREALYARALLATTRALATTLAPVAEPICRPRVMRIAFTGHVVARPWQLPPEEAAFWTRTYADAPAFWDLLHSAPSWHAPPPARPTTVAWGDRDRLLIYSRQAPRARRRLPGANHVTLAGCGHTPTWDDPEQVARVLLEASKD